MDGKEIFKEILKSPQMKELLGVSPGEFMKIMRVLLSTLKFQ